MPYTLVNDGDNIERLWWPELKILFPKYEEFWQKFISEDLTKRPASLEIRDDLDSDVEYLAMAHYSVFYHIGATTKIAKDITLKNNIKNDYPTKALISDYFFHSSSSTEMVERLLFHLWRINVKLGKLEDVQQISDEEILKKIKQNYAKRLVGFKNESLNVSIPVHSITDSIEFLISIYGTKNQFKERIKNFITIVGIIRPYRNKLAHNPLLMSIENNDDVHFPKVEKLKQYSRWSAFRQGMSNKNELISFTDLHNQIVTGYLPALNELWDSLISIMQIIYSDSSFSKLVPPKVNNQNLSNAKTSDSSSLHYNSNLGSSTR